MKADVVCTVEEFSGKATVWLAIREDSEPRVSTLAASTNRRFHTVRCGDNGKDSPWQDGPAFVEAEQNAVYLQKEVESGNVPGGSPAEMARWLNQLFS